MNLRETFLRGRRLLVTVDHEAVAVGLKAAVD